MAGSVSSQAPLLSEDLYKHTEVADYVVKRHIKLYRDRFETYADVGVPEDHRTFYLDSSAQLRPGRKDAIPKKKRHLRPRGVGSMTALAALRGSGATLELVRPGSFVQTPTARPHHTTKCTTQHKARMHTYRLCICDCECVRGERAAGMPGWVVGAGACILLRLVDQAPSTCFWQQLGRVHRTRGTIELNAE